MKEPKNTTLHKTQSDDISTDPHQMITVSELIATLKADGIRIGKTGSDTYNTLRYYIKIGLVSPMIRKYSKHEESVVGHFPVSIIGTLQTIEDLKDEGLSNPEIYDYLTEQDVREHEVS